MRMMAGTSAKDFRWTDPNCSCRLATFWSRAALAAILWVGLSLYLQNSGASLDVSGLAGLCKPATLGWLCEPIPLK